MAGLRGRLLDGSLIRRMLEAMKPRYNGLGAGFAAYGIYPDLSDKYVLHLMFDDHEAKRKFEEELLKRFRVVFEEEIPTRSIFPEQPLLWRYFIENGDEVSVWRFVMEINGELDGAYVVSSGRDMGVFKAVGYPDQVADFYRIEDYKGRLWLGHGRYPTNSPGWWGGSHPFNLLDCSVVHNGEISSYGISKRYLESKGYRFIFLTDSEMLSYAFDYLLRIEGLSLPESCKVLSPPFWNDLKDLEAGNSFLKILRIRYQELNINGPFSIAVALRVDGGLYLLGLADRLKLRPLVAGLDEDLFMLSSEECGIRSIDSSPRRVWRPAVGEAVAMRVDADES